MNEGIKPRLLVFIIAFNAGKTIVQSLHALFDMREEFLRQFDYEILLINDASTDNTFEKARAFAQEHPGMPVKLLFNPVSRGYGGNQKLGLHYAVIHDFDMVLLMHSECDYPASVVSSLIGPLITSSADFVIGSRILDNHKLIFQVPLHKYIGNQFLTWVQNRMLRAGLSDYLSGYRAFSVKAIREIPFERNSDGFVFDTEIIIQMMLGGYRIREVTVPAYHSPRIGFFKGLGYGRRILGSLMHFKMHSWYIQYQRNFDIDSGHVNYTPKLGYVSSHTLAEASVNPGSSVIDLGCDKGFIARELKNKGCYLEGVDLYLPPATEYFDKFHELNLNHIEKLGSLERFDHILILDVIEHLEDPEVFLDKIRAMSGRKFPQIVITTPNIAFIVIRLKLLFSSFNYGKQGILDMTHKRLFTFKSLRRMLNQSGYIISASRGVPVPFPKALGLNSFSLFLVWLNRVLIRISKNMFSYQIFMKVTPAPQVKFLLADSLDEASKRSLPATNTNK